MHRRWRRVAAGLLAGVLALGAAGCGQDRTGGPTYLPAGGATFRSGSPPSLTSVSAPLWPMLGGDPRHSGRMPEKGPRNPAVLVSAAGAPVPGGTQLAVGANGTAYVAGNRDGARLVAAISAAGHVLWQFPLGPAPAGITPALGPDDTVYVITAGRSLVALNPATGTPRWEKALPGSGEAGTASPVLTPDGPVVYAPGGGVLSAVTGAGALRWHWPADGALPWVGTPAVGPDGTIYLPAEVRPGEFALVGLSAAGAEQWRHPLPGRPGTPAVALDGLAHVAVAGADQTRVFAVRLNGRLRWEAMGPAWPVPDPLPTLARLDTLLGQYEMTGKAAITGPALPDGLQPASPAVVDGSDFRYLVAGGAGGHALLALDARGSVLWRHPLREPGSYPVLAGGRIYVVDAGQLLIVGERP